jgi:hypothetical protein
LATLARELGCGALLLYRIRPAGYAPWVTLELVLYDGAHQRTDRIEASLIGRSTGLVMLNPLMVALFAVAFLGALGWAVLISLRGTVVVRVQWDTDSKDELFSLLISRSPITPTIENLTAYRKKLEWLGKRKRRFEAWNIDQNTTFRSIPRGKWYVHLFGIYTRGRRILLLKEPPQQVEVQARKAAFVVHVLEAIEAEFRIVVVDDRGPVEGARVWLDDERAKAVAFRQERLGDAEGPQGLPRDARDRARDVRRAPVPSREGQGPRNDHQPGVGAPAGIRFARARTAGRRRRRVHGQARAQFHGRADGLAVHCDSSAG